LTSPIYYLNETILVKRRCHIKCISEENDVFCTEKQIKRALVVVFSPQREVVFTTLTSTHRKNLLHLIAMHKFFIKDQAIAFYTMTFLHIFTGNCLKKEVRVQQLGGQRTSKDGDYLLWLSVMGKLISDDYGDK
jgi:hypothetical protein